MEMTKEQMRKLETLHSNFAHMIHEHYTEVHGVVIDSGIAFVDITTMGEVIQSFHNPSASYTFTLEPFSGPAMIDYSLPIAYAFVKKALGQKEDGPMAEGERKVLHQVFERDLKDLLSTWEPIETITAADGEFETNPEYLAGAIPRDETVLLIAFEINGPDFSGLVNVVLPFSTIESVMGKVDAWVPAA